MCPLSFLLTSLYVCFVSFSQERSSRLIAQQQQLIAQKSQLEEQLVSSSCLPSVSSLTLPLDHPSFIPFLIPLLCRFFFASTTFFVCFCLFSLRPLLRVSLSISSSIINRSSLHFFPFPFAFLAFLSSMSLVFPPFRIQSASSASSQSLRLELDHQSRRLTRYQNEYHRSVQVQIFVVTAALCGLSASISV